MRRLGKAILATLALMMATAADAQEARPAPAAAGLPHGPVPYATLRPPKPRPQQMPPKPMAATKTLAATPGRAEGPHLASAAAIDATQLEAFLDGWIKDAMAREHVPGAAISVVQNGQLVLKKGYGFADLSPRRAVNPDKTLFRIGSISKTFTWILLMKEVEAGRIRLDRPINLYLPEKVRLSGKSRDVTVGSLLNHTSGFEDRALGQLFKNDPRRVRPLDLYLRQERPSRERQAGAISSYSNYGAALAGEAAAFVSGKTFERRVEDEIAMPLGMTSTTFREPRPERRGLPAAMPERLRGDVAIGYSWRNAGFFPDDYEYVGQIAPAGSASSTAADMSRYMLMLLNDGSWNGATVFGPGAARAFRSPMRQTPTGINGWAHGFMVFDLPGGHRGYGHLGDTMAFHSAMVVIPDLQLGVFVTTNGGDGAKLADRLPEAITRQFYGPPATFPRPGSIELLDAAKVFEGDYLSTRRAYGGLEGFVGLIAGAAKVEVTPGGRLLTGRRDETRAWTPEGPVGSGRFVSTTGDDRLAFNMQDGHAVSFRSGLNIETWQRAGLLQRQSTIVLMTALTALASLTTLIGLALRSRRELRQNQTQARAALVQNMQAALWIAAMTLFGVWGAGASDIPSIMYGWPGPLIITASTCALVAAALSLITIAAVPAIWQGGRRVESWTAMRKMFFTITVLIYAAFSVLLAMNGALEPWSR